MFLVLCVFGPQCLRGSGAPMVPETPVSTRTRNRLGGPQVEAMGAGGAGKASRRGGDARPYRSSVDGRRLSGGVARRLIRVGRRLLVRGSAGSLVEARLVAREHVLVPWGGATQR